MREGLLAQGARNTRKRAGPPKGRLGQFVGPPKTRRSRQRCRKGICCRSVRHHGTKRGVIKKTELSAHSNPRQGAASSRCRLDAGDKLIGVDLTDGQREILLGTNRASPSASGKKMCTWPWDAQPMACAGLPWRRAMKSSDGDHHAGFHTAIPHRDRRRLRQAAP